MRMSKSIELKMKFRTKVGVKLPTLRLTKVTQIEVTLSALVTRDLCQNNWILNKSINMQEARRGCDSQGKKNVYQSAQSCQNVE